jgi:nitric oxide dioxygenase
MADEGDPMTPQDKELVQNSFAKVAPIAPTAADLFYKRLFEIDPKLQTLFKGDMTEQGRKLMAMIGYVVTNLHRIEELVPAVKDLARRHVGYGVTAKDYDTVGSALLWTLEKGLGPDFTPETRAAWTTTYGALTKIMLSA